MLVSCSCSCSYIDSQQRDAWENQFSSCTSFACGRPVGRKCPVWWPAAAFKQRSAPLIAMQSPWSGLAKGFRCERLRRPATRLPLVSWAVLVEGLSNVLLICIFQRRPNDGLFSCRCYVCRDLLKVRQSHNRTDLLFASQIKSKQVLFGTCSTVYSLFSLNMHKIDKSLSFIFLFL